MPNGDAVIGMGAGKADRSLARDERGFLMAALLVAIAVMAIAMNAALPAWTTAARREKEAELVFRGEQYARAIGAYQRRNGGFPATIDVLVEQKFLRKKWKDPITGEDFAIVTPGSALPAASSVSLPGLTLGARSGGGSTSAPRGTGAGPTTTGSTLGGRPTTTTSTSAGRTGGSPGSTSLTGGATQGVMAVHSKSREKAFRVYNGLEYYNEWIFMATQASSTPGGGGGAQTPGAGTRGGGAGQRGGAPVGGRGTPPQGGGGRGTFTPGGGRGAR